MAKEKKSKEKAAPKEKKAKKEKSSSGGMQQMLMDHGEKIGMGIAGVICLACIVFGFIGKSSIDGGKTHTGLNGLVSAVDEKMASITYTPPKDPAWVGLAGSEAKVPPQSFVFGSFVRPLFPLQGVRSEPNYLKPVQLRVIAGRAPFNTGAPATSAAGVPAAAAAAGGDDPPDGSASKGEYYVVGTFLIPIRAQKAEYERVFGDTLKMPGDERPAQDSPEYYRYILERQQVTPGAPMDETPWVTIGEADHAAVTADNRQPVLEAKKAEWAETRQDIIPGPFLLPEMAYGKPLADEESGWLPPRLPKPTALWTWTEVGHGVIADYVRLFTEQEAAAAADAAKSADAATAVDPAEAMQKFADSQEYKMGRFWDFAVEPGAQYRYRVTLVLRNPNRGYTKQYLKNEALATGEFRPISPLDAADTNRPVSDPSYVVQLPGRSDIAVGGIVSESDKTNRTGEDLALIAASVWENTAEAIADYEKEVNAIRVPRLRETAMAALNTLKEVWANVDFVEASMEFRVARGQYMTMKSPTQITHPLFNKVETLKNVRFDTGFTLVDWRGGKAPARATGPASATPAAMAQPMEYLLLDPEGNLVIRTEVGDRAAYKRKLAAVTQAAAEDAAGATSTIDQLNK